jgi:hypothetical protein
MALGPIEIVVIAFEKGEFKGEILPEIERLVESNTISIVDGLFVRRPAQDELEVVEFAELTSDPGINALSSLLNRVDGLLSEEDADILTQRLPVGAAVAVLCFEHTWVKPLRDAIVSAGGELVDSIRVPGLVVQEVLDAVAALEK